MTFLQTSAGINGSVIGGLYGGGGAGIPAAAGVSAAGPRTIGQQGFGIVGGDTSGSNVPFYAAIGGGAFALGALIFIWYSLPR